MTRVYGVFGWPVAHSRSPAMHNAAFAALGLDAVYVPFAVPPDKLARAVEAVTALDVAGVNVTLPHKSAIMALLAAVEPTAQAIGAVNTVVRDGARLIGTNTDAAGLACALSEAGVALAASHAIVLGAGGAARAAVIGLAQAGAARIHVAARREDQARALVAQLAAHAPGCALHASDMGAQLRGVLSGATLLIQATSATLGDSAAARAFSESVPLDALPATAVVCDLVYKPLETALLARARGLGLRCVDGLGMLLHQGALAFERWTGQPAPLAEMRAALTAT